ncbi:MAG: adenylyltransferase/cytidyltransferase family protein [Parcubacteria group bacterium]|jgi:cytidyltransferase-like protein
MSKTRGLILGKFAPFHVGHERLIETALKEVDDLCVIVYDCPNLTNIPLNVRANWIRQFFPQVFVIEGWDAPNKHDDTVEVKKMQENYVQKALNGKKITHFFSSEYYGEHMSKFLGAVDRRLDRHDPRQGYLTTATMIRNGNNLSKHFLSAVVYGDMLIKVAFVGVPSQEQSKLVSYLAKKLHTSYIEDNMLMSLGVKQDKDNKHKKIIPDFYKIANKKYELANRESNIFSAKEYLVYNSTGFVDHLLSVATHGRFNKKMYDLFSEDMSSYDLVLVNNNPKKSIGKSLDIDDSIFLNQLIANLDTINVNYRLLSGTFREKLAISEKLINAVNKKFNLK